MPSGETFTIPPIAEFVRHWIGGRVNSIDPFARNSTIARWRNDMDLATSADFHMEAEAFCRELDKRGIDGDAALFDPPYSPRQISDCYRGIGLEVGQRETQSGHLYRRVRDALDQILAPGAIVLSFGWNSAGMGKLRGYELLEVLLVNHGGAHNDTICIAERKRPKFDLEGVAA